MLRLSSSESEFTHSQNRPFFGAHDWWNKLGQVTLLSLVLSTWVHEICVTCASLTVCTICPQLLVQLEGNVANGEIKELHQIMTKPHIKVSIHASSIYAPSAYRINQHCKDKWFYLFETTIYCKMITPSI